jgi:type IV pilus assembly protein PilV
VTSTRFTSARTGPRRAQRGVMLLEALIAILIFSIGILGLVGLQATAVQQSSDARYRADAAQLAEQLLGQMWVGNRTVTNLQTQFNTCTSSACPGYQTWYNTVKATLPGITTASMMPSVNVSNAPGTNGVVTISIFWRAPSDDPNGNPHRYDTEGQIGQ